MPPTPASSAQASQSFCPTFSGSLQSLSSTIYSTLLKPALSLRFASSAQGCQFQCSTSGLQACSSTSACRAVDSTLDPPSLRSTQERPPWSDIALSAPRTSKPYAATCPDTSPKELASSLVFRHQEPFSGRVSYVMFSLFLFHFQGLLACVSFVSCLFIISCHGYSLFH